MRGPDALIVSGEFRFFCQPFELFDEDGPVGQPEGEAGAYVFVKSEELHLAAEFAVVAPFGLLQHGEVGLHFGLLLEGRSVDPLQLGVPFVAFVVGARHMGEFEGADVARSHHVRARAQVDEVPVGVERNLFVLGNPREDVQLELAGDFPLPKRRQPPLRRQLHRLVPGHHLALEHVVGFDLLAHFLFDTRKILGSDPVAQLHIIIKPVVHRRAGRKLGIGPDLGNGGCQHMGGGMADPFQFGHLIFWIHWEKAGGKVVSTRAGAWRQHVARGCRFS